MDRRVCFFSPSRRFSSIRRCLAAREGLVLSLGFGAAAAFWIRAINRSMASWRLRSWLRTRRHQDIDDGQAGQEPRRRVAGGGVDINGVQCVRRLPRLGQRRLECLIGRRRKTAA